MKIIILVFSILTTINNLLIINLMRRYYDLENETIRLNVVKEDKKFDLDEVRDEMMKNYIHTIFKNL